MLENNENMLPVEKERQIQLVVNSNQEEGTIDLGNVFRNMKLTAVPVYEGAADGFFRGDAAV